MDHHSTHLQFNQRTPKSGPYTPATTRFMEKISVEKYAKPPPPAKSSPDPLLSLAQRPIATNSRVRQDEQFKRDMFIAFVNKALHEKLYGQSKDFDDLVDQFDPKKIGESATSSSQLRLWILALSHALSRLEKRHSSLVEAIVNLPWTTMDTAFVKSYSVFIGMLLSARPEYLSLVLAKIAQGLTYQSGLQALNAGGPEGSASPLTRSVVYDRLHHHLRHLLSLIPTLPSTLQPLIVRNFPHKRQPQVAQVTYIRNLLRITEYCSELADRILALIIDRVLQIDVEIQVELEELEQEDSPENGDLFEFDPFDVIVGQEGNDQESDVEDDDDYDSDISTDVSSNGGSADDDDDDEPELPSNMRHMQEMVSKLDHVLKLIFDHFNRLHYVTEPSTITPSSPPGSPFSPADTPSRSPSPTSGRAMRASQFHTLLAIFDRSIIRTFKSRYTQFLVFWYSSLDPEFSDLFQGLLVEKALLGQDVPTVTRAAAASYIASFVSRAQFVDREGARRMMTVLCTFLRNHLDALDSFGGGGLDGRGVPAMGHHSVFYAIAQAVFLIFCFRWRDFEEDFDEDDELGGGGGGRGGGGIAGVAGGGRKWMSELDVVQRAITCVLNPLKVCSPTVVMQFARVARATDFVYCHSIIEANRRSSEYNPSAGAPSSSSQSSQSSLIGLMARVGGPGGDGSSASEELHTFFPFDPYKLPRSSSYIQGLYREWSSVAIGGDEESDYDDDDDDDDEQEGQEGQEEQGTRYEVGLGGMRTEAVVSRVRGADADGLGDSFGGMSISPAQPRSVVTAS